MITDMYLYGDESDRGFLRRSIDFGIQLCFIREVWSLVPVNLVIEQFILLSFFVLLIACNFYVYFEMRAVGEFLCNYIRMREKDRTS